MSVDRNVFFGRFVQQDLLVGLGEIEDREFSASGQCCEELFGCGERVLIYIQHLINGDFVVPTDAKFPALLRDCNVQSARPSGCWIPSR